MANFIPNGWLLDAIDPGWSLSAGWSIDTALGELQNDGSGSWDGAQYYEWEAIPPEYTGTVYWSVEITEFTSGTLDYFSVCGVSQTPPSGVGVYSGEIASGYDHSNLFFIRDGGGWVGKIKHIWVGDTPPPSGSTGQEGAGAATASPATASGSGQRIVSGSGNVAAQGPVSAGSGKRVVSGAGNSSPQAATAGGQGGKIVQGDGSVASSESSSSGSGLRTPSGEGNPVVREASASGTGEVLGAVNGVGNATTESATSSGSGQKSVNGTGDALAASASATGSGDVVSAVTGSGHAVAGGASSSGAGTKIAVGIGIAEALPSSSFGTGWTIILGTGDVYALAASVRGGDQALDAGLLHRSIFVLRNSNTVFSFSSCREVGVRKSARTLLSVD